MQTLRNGAQASSALVDSTMEKLRKLLRERPLDFCRLVNKCRNRNYGLDGHLEADLKARQLMLSDGSVDDSIANIAVSAVDGEGLDMLLRDSPVAQSK